MTAYLLVENKGRELASRLLIAKALAEMGIPSVVGQQKALNPALPGIEPSVVLHKGLNRIAANAMRNAPAHTHVALDEEAMGVATFAHASIDHDHEAPVREVYTGAFAADYAARYGTVVKTGNPRADLCGMSHLWLKEAQRIRKRHGKFVLVDTNIGSINSNWGPIADYARIIRRVGWVAPATEITEHFVDDAIALDRIVRLVEALLPVARVIVRPHPAERADLWPHLFGDAVQVEPGGWHLPWLAAAQAVVHTGCTTGYEAALMGRPAVALLRDRPIDKVFAANAYNATWTPAEAVARVQDIIAGAPFQSASPGACDAHVLIAERLAALDTGSAPADTVPAVDRTDYEKAKMTTTLDEAEALYRRMGGTSPVRQVGDSVFVVG